MITNCPYCGDPLYEETVKTYRGDGTSVQLNCPVHGFINKDVKLLGKKFESFKSIFGKYHKIIKAVKSGEQFFMCDVQENFTDAEWKAIEGLVKDED